MRKALAGIGVATAAALLIGAAPTLIDFFFHTGQGITSPLG